MVLYQPIQLLRKHGRLVAVRHTELQHSSKAKLHNLSSVVTCH